MMQNNHLQLIHSPEYLFALLLISYYATLPNHECQYSDENEKAHRLTRLLNPKYALFEKNSAPAFRLKSLSQQYLSFTTGVEKLSIDIATSLLKIVSNELPCFFKHHKLFSFYLFNEKKSSFCDIKILFPYCLMILTEYFHVPLILRTQNGFKTLSEYTSFHTTASYKTPILGVDQNNHEYQLILINNEQNQALLKNSDQYSHEKKLYKKIQTYCQLYYLELHEKIPEKQALIKKELQEAQLSFLNKKHLYFEFIHILSKQPYKLYHNQSALLYFKPSPLENIEHLLEETLSYYIAFDLLPHPLKKMIFHS